jgi:2'-5' RNA ligase
MPEKSYNTAVVVIPPQELWEPIQQIRRQHDRHVRRWMPHINLLYPFRPRSQFAFLAERFASVCHSLSTFTITMREVKYFEHGNGNYTLWLAPEPTEPLRHLLTILQQIVPDCQDTSGHAQGFVPHLSLGQAKGQESFRKLLGTLQREWQTMSFSVSQISMIWREEPPNDTFHVAEKICWQPA